MMKFEVGKKYDCRSICDGDCVFEFKVIKRTEKTITIKDSFGKEKRCKIYAENNEEYIYPLGKYSMCPTLRSSKEVKEKTQNVEENAIKTQNIEENTIDTQDIGNTETKETRKKFYQFCMEHRKEIATLIEPPLEKPKKTIQTVGNVVYVDFGKAV